MLVFVPTHSRVCRLRNGIVPKTKQMMHFDLPNNTRWPYAFLKKNINANECHSHYPVTCFRRSTTSHHSAKGHGHVPHHHVASLHSNCQSSPWKTFRNKSSLGTGLVNAAVLQVGEGDEVSCGARDLSSAFLQTLSVLESAACSRGAFMARQALRRYVPVCREPRRRRERVTDSCSLRIP